MMSFFSQLIVIAFCAKVVLSGRLKMSSCSQPFTLDRPSHQDIVINLKPSNATLIMSQPMIKTTAFKVTKYSMLCQDSFNNMFNGYPRCEKETKIMTYNAYQIKEMMERKLCYIGRDCTLDTCYSHETRHCKQDILDRYGWPHSSGNINTGIKLVYSSCYLSWDCAIQELVAPVYADAEKEAFYFHFNSNEKTYLASNDMVYHIDGWNFLVPALASEALEEKVQCLHSKAHTVCDLPGRESSVLMNSKGIGAAQNYLIKSVRGSPEHSILNSGNPTAEQLRTIVTELVEEDLKDKYNFMVLRNQLNEIFNRLFNVAITGEIENLIGLKKSSNTSILRIGENEFSICKQAPSNPYSSLQHNSFRRVAFYTETPLYQEELSTSLVRDDYETRRFQEIERRLNRDEGISSHPGQEHSKPMDSGLLGMGFSHVLEMVKLYGGLCGMLALIILIFRR